MLRIAKLKTALSCSFSLALCLQTASDLAQVEPMLFTKATKGSSCVRLCRSNALKLTFKAWVASKMFLSSSRRTSVALFIASRPTEFEAAFKPSGIVLEAASK